VIAPGSPVSVLTELPRWVGWRNEKRASKPDAKRTKVPYTPGLRGRLARTDNPSTWASYDEACKMEGCDGPGLVMAGLVEVAALDLERLPRSCDRAHRAVGPRHLQASGELR